MATTSSGYGRALSRLAVILCMAAAACGVSKSPVSMNAGAGGSSASGGAGAGGSSASGGAAGGRTTDAGATGGAAGGTDAGSTGVAGAGVALINVGPVPNAAVMGAGTIDGRGGEPLTGTTTTWWDLEDTYGGNLAGPRLVQVTSAKDFTLAGVTLKNSTKFHVVISNT